MLIFLVTVIGPLKKRLKFGWNFDLSADFTADKASEMKTRLFQKFVDWNTKLKKLQHGTPFCVKADCSDVIINVTNNMKDFHIEINIDAVA